MKEYIDTAVILRIIPYQETDAVVEVFGKEVGKISLVVKGLFKEKSKNKGLCRVGSIVGIEFFASYQNAEMGKLKRFTHQSSLLTEDFILQSMVFLVCEILHASLPLHHPEEFVFQQYISFFTTSLSSQTMLWFLVQYFTALGMFPDFSVARHYKNTSSLYWEEKRGIVESVSIGESFLPLSLDSVKVFYHLMHQSVEFASRLSFSQEQQKELWKIFWWFYAFHFLYPPKSRKILEDVGVI